VAIPLAFIAAGLFGSGSARFALIGAGVVSFVLIPALIQHRLENLAQRVSDASREEALELKRTLRAKPLVNLFAPAAWVTLQDAQIALRLGDGKAAAQLYAETARLCKRPDAVMLVSAQAHALVVANERKAARELLNKLAAAKLLGPRDQLDLGIVMLLDSQKKSRQAMAYIEAARKTIGDHPRVVAAMALALQRSERVDEAAELLEKAQISLQEEPDSVVEVLVHRARREMRRYIEAQLRRERRARSRRTTIVVTSEHAVSEVVSGEIGSRPDSGAQPQAHDSEAAAEAAAAEAADAEALRARGWQDPSSFATKVGEDGTPKPKVKVELRDTSVGEPIRIEGSYALKKKEDIERERPKDPRRRRREAGPAIDIDLSLDEDDDFEVEEASAKDDAASEPAAPTKPELEPEVKPAPAEVADSRDTPEVSAPEPSPGGIAASIRIDPADDENAAPPPRDEISDMRRKASLSESLAETLGALDSGMHSPPKHEDEGNLPEEEASESPRPAEADAPVAMRRRRTTATGGGLPKPPPFPSLQRRSGGKLPTFSPPSQRTESDPAKPSFKPQNGDKG
jgi:tetratricopeptide (TPR) repeat protein